MRTAGSFLTPSGDGFVGKRISDALICVLLGLGLHGCRSGCDPEDWVARIETVVGTVSVSEPAEAKPEPAVARQALRVGARLETGRGSVAELALRGGGRLEVEPDTVLIFQGGRPGGQAGASLVLEQGRVVGTAAQVEASELVIGVDGRRIRLRRASKAAVEAANEGDGAPRLLVSLGEATVEMPSGEAQRVVAGDELILSLAAPKPKQPDARVPDAEPDVVQAEELKLFLTSRGRGRLLVKASGARRFTSVRRGKRVEVQLGTQLRLAARARVVVSSEDGRETVVRGPAEFVVREAVAKEGEPAALRLESTGRDLVIQDKGRRGKKGARFVVEGVRIATAIAYRSLDVRVRRTRQGATVVVGQGEVRLTSAKGKKVRVEAGQQALLSKGTISGPKDPTAAPITVDKAGTLRLFVASKRLPVRLKWQRPQGSPAMLVQVSPRSSFARARFSDAIQRSSLTLTLPRGTSHWRVRALDKSGKPGETIEGRLSLVRDTSYRVLKNRRPPRNIIHETFGDTVVFYQNSLPHFEFRWRAVSEANSYVMKLFRAQNLTRPYKAVTVRRPSVRFKSGTLGEGRYLWYVAARGRDRERLETSPSRRLRIRYDNATPDLQIVHPRNRLTVSAPSVEVRGVTIPGSTVSVNGKAAELDETFRFRHSVALKPGVNYIVFQVTDQRRGPSVYLREVIRR